MNFDHIAILYPTLDPLVEYLSEAECWMGDVETFESEGTRELYFGPKASSSKVLALQAISDGPYQRALEKRGPGIHHVAFSTTDLAESIRTLNDWNLHPITEKTKEHGTAWFSKPGEPYLLELFEGGSKGHAMEIESPSSFLAAHLPFQLGDSWRVTWGSWEIPLP